MTNEWREAQARVRNFMQILAFGLIVVAALAAVATSLLAAFGAMPWIEILGSYGGQPINGLGMGLQLGATVLLVGLCFFLPANGRIMKLERSHRDFHISMEDIERAYRIAHAADRSGAFTLSSEFDDVRDRIKRLREHPDLAALEPEVLEVAAQMSRTSKDLSVIYSDERVARAKTFLTQRQEEVDDFRDQIALAQRSTDEIKRWLADIEAEERMAETEIARLEKDLREVLPGLGYDFDDPTAGAPAAADSTDGNVVTMPAKAPAS